jgi:peptide-methionine (S)-S-oxide reductase
MKTIRSHWPLIALLLGLCALAWQVTSRAGESAVSVAPPAVDSPKAGGKLQTAVLAGGCFWGVQQGPCRV